MSSVKKINNGSIDTELKLKELIENIRNNYRDNLKELCDDNIVSIIQFIKNVDLIIKQNKLIAISNKLRPPCLTPPCQYNYKIINNETN
uniref:Uncharacterized protein n=1 Tax=viral metagenome TaxID=1070528 RepID=A0A6C0EN48_9ZZZZ